MEKRFTEKGKTYWNGEGVYQEEYEKLYKELVPVSGEADTVHGELLRCSSRLHYDYFNNGNINVLEHAEEPCHECDSLGYTVEECSYCDHDGDDCYECDGDGEIVEDCMYCDGYGSVDGEVFVTEYYSNMITFLTHNVKNNNPLVNLQNFLLREDLGYSLYEFSDKESGVYTDLIDEVMYTVLTTENKPL